MDHEVEFPLVSLQLDAVFDGPERINLVHVSEFHNLDALVLLQVVLSL